mmetsp:Transcript_100840/g.284441  ORF Transcript_100840/g.284441 Transcript_100840/m.284441 type:complete len:220 (-) Transcript_100840:29-688(-)
MGLYKNNGLSSSFFRTCASRKYVRLRTASRGTVNLFPPSSLALEIMRRRSGIDGSWCTTPYEFGVLSSTEGTTSYLMTGSFASTAFRASAPSLSWPGPLAGRMRLLNVLRPMLPVVAVAPSSPLVELAGVDSHASCSRKNNQTWTTSATSATKTAAKRTRRTEPAIDAEIVNFPPEDRWLWPRRLAAHGDDGVRIAILYPLHFSTLSQRAPPARANGLS